MWFCSWLLRAWQILVVQEHVWEIPGRILRLRMNWWWLLCGGLVAEPWTLMEGCFRRWVQRKEAFWNHPGARITSSSCFLPSQGSCRGVREKNVVTRCRQEKYVEEESVCFSSMFWLGHYQMKLIFSALSFLISASMCLRCLEIILLSFYTSSSSTFFGMPSFKTSLVCMQIRACPECWNQLPLDAAAFRDLSQ